MFSKEVRPYCTIYKIFGKNIYIKNREFYKRLEIETKKSILIQNNYDLELLKKAKSLILFLVPESNINVTGGVISIFSLAFYTREITNELTLISTYPNSKYTYAKNELFKNDEIVYRFSQIRENCKNLENLIVHIPESYSDKFYSDLKKEDIEFLKSIKNLHINILNQNIELMKTKKEISPLLKLTKKLTQTTAHEKYATQENADKWGIPIHLFSAYTDVSMYKAYSFNEKEKIIAISPDFSEKKDEVIQKLKNEFPDWNFITVQNMKFSEFMDLISRAFFTITFGEGFDGYFQYPYIKSSIGLTVYRKEFFPKDESWIEFPSVFKNYDEMLEKIVDFIKYYSKNQEEYENLSGAIFEKIVEIYGIEKYRDNLKRFYERKYDYLPKDLA